MIRDIQKPYIPQINFRPVSICIMKHVGQPVDQELVCRDVQMYILFHYFPAADSSLRYEKHRITSKSGQRLLWS